MSFNEPKRLLIHAPNIHTGGGLYLLQSLLNFSPSPCVWAQLDRRIEATILLPQKISRCFVKNNLLSRLYAEWRLKKVSRPGDLVLCFHGLPPLIPISGLVIVFLQNKLIFDESKLNDFTSRDRLRLRIERWLMVKLQRHVSRYIVQSNSMELLVRRRLKGSSPVIVSPFFCTENIKKRPFGKLPFKKFDFVYVASGDAHKNHLRLLEAWCLLADAGIKPFLALTVDFVIYQDLCQKINAFQYEFGLKIINLGYLQREAVTELYLDSNALIFPSLSESFGLPLIEAGYYSLPVIASERDYVRDIVHPTETFDPLSPLSISRAVKRFLKIPEPSREFQGVGEFLAGLQQ